MRSVSVCIFSSSDGSKWDNIVQNIQSSNARITGTAHSLQTQPCSFFRSRRVTTVSEDITTGIVVQFEFATNRPCLSSYVACVGSPPSVSVHGLLRQQVKAHLPPFGAPKHWCKQHAQNVPAGFPLSRAASFGNAENTSELSNRFA
jgi:hypothetical protein